MCRDTTKMLQRKLSTEFFDQHDPSHREAIQSRKDLGRINFLMGNFRWFKQQFSRMDLLGEHCVDLGAGAGDLGRYLYDQALGEFFVTGVDFLPRPLGSNWPSQWDWCQGDLCAFEGWEEVDVCLANLTLHRFTNEQLAELGSKIKRNCRAVLVCEPARRRIHQWEAFGLNLLGVNHMTYHNTHVGIEAGFLGNELSECLGLEATKWDIDCRTTALGAYRMVAVKKDWEK